MKHLIAIMLFIAVLLISYIAGVALGWWGIPISVITGYLGGKAAANLYIEN